MVSTSPEATGRRLSWNPVPLSVSLVYQLRTHGRSNCRAAKKTVAKLYFLRFFKRASTTRSFSEACFHRHHRSGEALHLVEAAEAVELVGTLTGFTYLSYATSDPGYSCCCVQTS